MWKFIDKGHNLNLLSLFYEWSNIKMYQTFYRHHVYYFLTGGQSMLNTKWLFFKIYILIESAGLKKGTSAIGFLSTCSLFQTGDSITRHLLFPHEREVL